MFDTLLQWDKDALIWASALVGAEYAPIIQILAEFVVVWGALMLITLWLSWVRHRDNTPKIVSLHIAVLVVFVFMIYSIINLWLPQWRASPQTVVANMSIHTLIPRPADNSFPSGHGLFTGALLVGLYLYYRRTWLIVTTLIIGLVTTIARVLGGVHYFGDIIGGFVIGILAAIILAPVARKVTEWIAPYCLRIASWVKL